MNFSTYKFLNDNQEIITNELQKFKKENTSSRKINKNMFEEIENLNENEKILSFEKLQNNGLKDIFFNFSNSFLDYKIKKICRNKLNYECIGIDYLLIKSLIRKKINKEEDSEDMLSKFNKMSLAHREDYKERKLEINSKYNIYEDILEYIEIQLTEQNDSETDNKFEFKIKAKEIYDQIVLNEVSDLIINKILDNKSIYIGLVIVRDERLNNLYEKLKELKNNL